MIRPRIRDFRADELGEGPVGTALAWLVHPVTVAATVLLIVNDHVLKAAYPSWLTGKLSDIAGLVMAPAVVAVLLAVATPRLRPAWHALIAVGLVGAVFTAVKASSAVAGHASTAWSMVNGPSVVLADRTDLLALPVLGLAWWTWRSARARTTLRRWTRLVAVLVVLPVAGLGIAATSAPIYDDAVAITEWRGMIMVGIDNAYHKQSRTPADWMASQDDGLTFSYLSAADHDDFAGALPGLTLAGQSDCSARLSQWCFRVVPGHLAVEESDDGGATWQVAWRVGEAERARLASRYPESGELEEYLSSRVLVVRDQLDGGVVVLAANGRDGFARRDATGQWERIGFGTFVTESYTISSEPEPIPGATPRSAAVSAPIPLVGAFVVAAIVIWIGCSVALVRLGRAAVAATSGGLLFPGAVVMLCGVGIRESDAAGIGYLGLVAGIGLTLSAVLVATVGARLDGALTAAGVARVAGAGLCCGGLVIAPFLARVTVGWPSQPAATVLASLAALLAVALSVPFARANGTRGSTPTGTASRLPSPGPR